MTETATDADLHTLALVIAAEQGPEAVRAVADYLAANPHAFAEHEAETPPPQD